MPTLDDIRGKYSGRCAVVLGAGPSLRMINDRPLVNVDVGGCTMHVPDVTKKSALQKHVIIAVNDAILKAPDADFYLTSDPGMCQYHHWNLLCSAQSSAKIVVNTPPFTRENMRLSFGVPTERIVLYQKRKACYEMEMSQRDGKIIYGPSSGHCAAHFAVMLGCKRIYLIGFDSMCVSGHKYFWQFRDQPGPGGTTTGHANHHLKSLARIGRSPDAAIYEDFDARTGEPSKPAYNGWMRLRRSNPNIDIVDASGGALHDVFPKVSAAQMLEGKP